MLNLNLPGVIGEDSGVACAEVEGTSVVIADEDGGLSITRVEVKPLLSL